MDTGLGEALRSGACFLQGHHGAELHRTAICLAGSLNATTEGHGTPSRHSLWIRAQSLALVGLFLESRGRQETSMSAAMQKRMARVHDRLLSDLSCAPTLLELAVEAGTSVPTLARAFRRQYGQSVYSLFQQERMQHARTQLLRGQFSVMHVATDLGYSNASHFAAAFRKHFGVNPSAVRESRRGGAQRRPGSPR